MKDITDVANGTLQSEEEREERRATGMSRDARRTYALVGALALLSVAIRVPFFQVPMITDEGGYSYVAHFWSADYQLYRDIPFSRPQGIFWIYQLIFQTLGTTVGAIRLFAGLYNALTVVAVFAFCREVFGRREALVSAAVYAVFSAAPRIEGFSANAEIFTLLPLVLSAHLTWRREWFWAGVLGGIGFLIKPSAVSAPLLTVPWALLWIRSLRGAVSGSAGFVVGLVPGLLHAWWHGWHHFMTAVYYRRILFYDTSILGPRFHIDGIQLAVRQTASSWGVPLVLTAIGADRLAKDVRLFVLLWMLSSFVGIAIGTWWSQHYFMQVIPPLAFLSGAGATRLARHNLRVVWGALLALALVYFGIREAPLWFEGPRQISWDLYHRNGYMAQDLVVDYVRAHTRPDDKIYIAFSQAEVYYLAERKAAVPEQLYWAHVLLSQHTFDQVIQSLRNGEPDLVVLVQPPPGNRMAYDDFLAVLDARYRRSDVILIPDPGLGVVLMYERKPE